MTVEELKQLSYKHPIIAYDGHCFLCHKTIKVFMKNDAKGVIRFVQLQDKIGEELIKHLAIIKEDETVILLQDGSIYTHSDVAIKISKFLSFPYRVMSIFTIFPKAFRDYGYRWIARNRYRWFGKSETCIVLSSEERERILV